MKLQENEKQRKPLCGEFCDLFSQNFALKMSDLTVRFLNGWNEVVFELSEFNSDLKSNLTELHNIHVKIFFANTVQGPP